MRVELRALNKFRGGWLVLPTSQTPNSLPLTLLRLFLALAGFGWIVMIVGVFIKWSDAINALEAFGAQPIPYDRMLDYWMRMFSGAFALLGCWYLLLMIWPRKFASAIPWFGGLMLIEGCIVLVHGIRLALPPFPFYADTAACLVSGIGILYFARSAAPAPCEASGLSSSPPPERKLADH